MPQKTTLKELRDKSTTFQTLVELVGRIEVTNAMLGDKIDGEDEVIYSGSIYQTGEDPLRFHVRGETCNSLFGRLEKERPYPFLLAIVKGEYRQEVYGHWDDYYGIIKKDHLILHSLQLKESD